MMAVLRERATWVMAAVLVVLVALEATVVPHYSPKFPWHYVPGYAASIGLGACLLVVILSKALGKAFLQRPERDDD